MWILIRKIIQKKTAHIRFLPLLLDATRPPFFPEIGTSADADADLDVDVQGISAVGVRGHEGLRAPLVGDNGAPPTQIWDMVSSLKEFINWQWTIIGI